MSKSTLFLAVPTVIALAGLAVWNLALQAEIEELIIDSSVAVEMARNVAPDASDAGVAARSERTSKRMRQLEARLEAMEAQSVAAKPGASGASSAGALSAAAATSDEEIVDEVAAALSDGPDAVFKAKVYAALDEREERRRAERREREAQRMAERLLRGIEVTDQQAAQVAATMLDYFGKRDALRRQEDLEPEAKRERFKELATERNTTIEAVVGAEAYAEVAKRVEARTDGNRNRNRGRRQRGGNNRQDRGTD